MIQYSLKCEQDHRFESWFQSADAFDKLAAAGMVSCAICGSKQVEKAIMAPRVTPARNKAAPASSSAPAAPATDSVPAPQAPLRTPQTDAERALSEMRRQIEANSDYVGTDFASEARAMHEGDAPERAIHGEARLDEAKALIEDGVPVAPLPFMPAKKVN